MIDDAHAFCLVHHTSMQQTAAKKKRRKKRGAAKISRGKSGNTSKSRRRNAPRETFRGTTTEAEPFIGTVELPSLWTIRRARTVILVITQTLAAYRLAKADKWGQVFTDATSRRQVTFQNLLISIEEDELYR